MPDSLVRRALRRAGVGRQDQSIESLTQAVRELAEAQRQQAVQLKKLLEAQQAQDRRWEKALDRWQKSVLDTSRREHHEAMHTQERVQTRWQEVVGSLRRSNKHERKWHVIFARQ